MLKEIKILQRRKVKIMKQIAITSSNTNRAIEYLEDRSSKWNGQR